MIETSTTPITSKYKLDTPRNFAAFATDMLAFMIGLSFIPATIVLVGMASRLTNDKVLLGVVAMAGSVGWFLPQIVAARIVHGKKRQKVYLVSSALIGRQAYLIMAIWLFVTQAQSPLLTVLVLVACILLFHVADSLAGVAWFDMLSRALSPRMRGRSVAIGNFIGLVGGIGSGLIVERVLAPAGLPFPLNYAVIFLCAWFSFMISFIGLLFIQETPMSEDEHTQANETRFFTVLREVVRTDPIFRKLILARIFTGIEIMAAAFYVVFIRERLLLDDSSLGLFTIASVVGGIVGIAFFGFLSDRRGSRGVILVSVALQILGPSLAFLVAVFPALADGAPQLAIVLFLMVIGIVGAVGQAGMLGFQVYPLDAAPERQRALYIGVLNSVGGVVSLTPVIGGVLLDVLTRSASSATAYSVVFGIAVVCVIAGLLISITLPHPTPR